MKLSDFTLKGVKNVFKKVNLKMILILISIIIIVYILNSFLIKRESYNPLYANKEYIDNDDYNGEKEATLYFFYANWCPHCNRAKEVGGPWFQFKSRHGEQIRRNNTIIDIKEVDCTDDKANGIASKLKTYNVKGYPTIILDKDGEHYLYDTKPDPDKIEQFIDRFI